MILMNVVKPMPQNHLQVEVHKIEPLHDVLRLEDLQQAPCEGEAWSYAPWLHDLFVLIVDM